MSNEIDLPHAVLRVVSPNELGFDQKDDGVGVPTMEDPLKLRFGAWYLDRGKFYIGCIGFDVLRRKDGKVHREEVGFLKLAVDEMVDNDGDPVPMIELFLCPKVGQSQDADMQRVFTMSRKGIVFHVPVNAAPVAARVSRFYTDHNQYCVNWQDDGEALPRGIVYETHGSMDETTWTPVAILKPEAL